MKTSRLPESFDCLAPDGSEIRLLSATGRGSMVHCTLPPGKTSLAVAHLRVEEIWYCLEGHGQVWRKLGESEEVVDASPGVSLTIPAGAHFQFRNSSDTPLRFVLTTMPPWPGDSEACRVPDHWPVDR
jgi:mannose-6-phosphate isomerase-like protein (cupin superfamily)